MRVPSFAPYSGSRPLCPFHVDVLCYLPNESSASTLRDYWAPMTFSVFILPNIEGPSEGMRSSV